MTEWMCPAFWIHFVSLTGKIQFSWSGDRNNMQFVQRPSHRQWNLKTISSHRPLVAWKQVRLTLTLAKKKKLSQIVLLFRTLYLLTNEIWSDSANVKWVCSFPELHCYEAIIYRDLGGHSQDVILTENIKIILILVLIDCSLIMHLMDL